MKAKIKNPVILNILWTGKLLKIILQFTLSRNASIDKWNLVAFMHEPKKRFCIHINPSLSFRNYLKLCFDANNTSSHNYKIYKPRQIYIIFLKNRVFCGVVMSLYFCAVTYNAKEL